MTREEAVALLERYSNYDGMGIPNLAGCKEAMKVAVDLLKKAYPELRESNDEQEDVIIVHLGRVLSDEMYNQVVDSIVALLDKKYPCDTEWHLDS